ncbi:MAG: type II secretion system protein [Kiritimatiellae bacterium]|nr:type II secretion system protein [Kiritimatiellia bacterium]
MKNFMETPTHSLNNSRAAAAQTLSVKPRCGFTIVELIIVMGVMAVLLAIALPTVKSIRLAAERKKAAIQATLLTQAVIKYKDVYGFWPGQLKVIAGSESATPKLELRDIFKNQEWTPVIISRYLNTDFQVTTAHGSAPIYMDQNELYRALNTIDPDNKEGPLYRPNPLNPKQIDFIDLEEKLNSETTRFQDPWGQEFIVFMGLNPRSTFTHTINISGGHSYRIAVSNNIAFAFSRGPNGNLSTNYIFSAGVK